MKKFKKNLLLFIFSLMAVSHLSATQYFWPTETERDKSIATLREKWEKNSEQITEDELTKAGFTKDDWSKLVVGWVQKKQELQQYWLPPARQDNFIGSVFQYTERNAVWGAASFLYMTFLGCLNKGIFQEGARRIERSITRWMFRSPLIRDENVAIPEDLYLDDLILNQEVKELAETIIDNFTMLDEGYEDIQFHGRLFSGLYGTGKSQLAKTIASEVSRVCDVKYYFLTGHDLATAKKEEIEDLIITMTSGKKPTIVIVDECEPLLESRDLIFEQGRADKANPVFNWLTLTEKPSDHIQFLYMTNYPEKIEDGMRRRIKFYDFEYPDAAERALLLQHYANVEFIHNYRYSDQERATLAQVFSKETIASLAQKLTIPSAPVPYKQGNVFSPADIAIMIKEIKAQCLVKGKRILPTQPMIAKIVASFAKSKASEVESIAKRFAKRMKNL